MRTVFTQRTHDGTTERLLQLAFAYFATYILTGIAPKYFMDAAPGYPAMNDVMRIIRDSKAEIVKQESGMSCIVVVRIRMGAAEGLTGQLHRIDSVEAQVDTL